MSPIEIPSAVRWRRVLGTTVTVVTVTFAGACGGGGSDPSPQVTDNAATESAADDELATTVDAGAASTCTSSDRTPVTLTGSWAHPSQSFYAGDEVDIPAAADLEHLLRADGAAIVRYRIDALPDASLDALRSWAENGVAVVALPAERDGAAPLTVDTVDQTLSCDGLDTVQLDSFVAERDFGDIEAH